LTPAHSSKNFVAEFIIPGYSLRVGSGLDRALLLKFMQRTYRELYPEQNFGHLAQTVEQYLSRDTPLWWVEQDQDTAACLWVGNATDQIQGDRHAYIFLLYVNPTHRRQGIGAALMAQAEDWARGRGDRQIGLQVFHHNQAALHLYEKLGYTPQSLWLTKSL
jgi:ribosomal protein S18 acetylase RimI-like enzyme